MNADIAKLSDDLKLGPEGIWSSADRPAVSYPPEGNTQCYQIEDNSFWFSHRNRCLLAAIERFGLPPPFVDVGGGNGVVSQAISAAGHSPLVLEPGPDGARNAKARGLKDVICSTFENAKFHDGSLGSIGCFDVIEHLEDDEEFLRECFAKLAPGGLLYATVPAFSWLWSADDSEAGHFRRYSRSGFESLLAKTGFHPLYSTYMFSFLVPAIFAMRSLKNRFAPNRKPDLKSQTAAHRGCARGFSPLLNAITRWELARIRKNKHILFGSSILIVATKK